MPDQPRLEDRPEVPYVAVPCSGPDGQALRDAVDAAFPALFRRLGALGVAPVGAPFIRFLSFVPDGPFTIEVGAPVGAVLDVGAGHEAIAGTLPAGRYAVHVHRGAYRATTERWEGHDLPSAYAHLNAWAGDHGVAWDGEATPDAQRLRSAVERYLVGPVDAADPERWETEIAILTRP